MFFLFYILKERKALPLLFNDIFFFFLFIVLDLQYDYIFSIILLQFILFYTAIYFSCKINFVSRPFSFYCKYLIIFLLFISTLFVKEKELSYWRKIQLHKTICSDFDVVLSSYLATNSSKSNSWGVHQGKRLCG